MWLSREVIQTEKVAKGCKCVRNEEISGKTMGDEVRDNKGVCKCYETLACS